MGSLFILVLVKQWEGKWKAVEGGTHSLTIRFFYQPRSMDHYLRITYRLFKALLATFPMEIPTIWVQTLMKYVLEHALLMKLMRQAHLLLHLQNVLEIRKHNCHGFNAKSKARI